MYQFTTPTFVINIPQSAPVATFTSLVVVFEQKQCNVKVRKTLNDVQLDSEHNKITVSLSQEETGKFSHEFPAKVQCHIKINDTALSTDEMEVNVYENIDGRVIL